MNQVNKKLTVGRISIVPVWSDSMGAKSFSIFIDTGDIHILIDPGVAILQPSFPISIGKKIAFLSKAEEQISHYASFADIVTITHYHYDHYSPDDLSIYKDKLILAKNPNQFINASQRERAELFLSTLYNNLTGREMQFTGHGEEISVEDPLNKLPEAMSVHYGEYQTRKNNLLKKGKKWFDNLVAKWNKWPTIHAFKVGKTQLTFADNNIFKFKATKIRFSEPLFHGIEFSRVGWVLPLIIEKGNTKILYSSDLNGPIIEDYATWIIHENPDVLFLDGPATYTIPYMLNMINFRRVTKNLETILRSVDSEIIFLDHHLTRDVRFRKRLKPIYDLAKELNKNLITFAEWHNRKSVADQISST